MALEQCSDLQLILLTIFVIFHIVVMEQIGEYIYLKKDIRMKIKIISARLPRFFNGERFPSFTDDVTYFIMYKKHWWQEYRYLKDCFGFPMKFNSQKEAEEYLKKNGIDYKKK